MISFDRSLIDHFTLKVQCKGIGSTPKSQVDRITGIFKSMQQIVHFSNFYQGQLREQTISAFPEKDWNSLGVRLQVIEDESLTQWPEIMIFQKPWVLYGIVDLNSVEMETLKDDVVKLKRRAQDERLKLVRILLINGREDFFKNIEGEKQYIIVPPLNDEKLSIYLEDQLQIFLCDVVLHFAYEIQKLKTDTSAMVLFNMREEKISDQGKLKRRKMGRQLKMMGDFSMLALSPEDALNYYRMALDALKKNEDTLWVACIYEACAAAKFFEREVASHFKPLNQDPQKLNEEIEEHFREALVHFKKTKFTVLEIECFFKLMQFRKDTDDKVGLNKTVNLFLKTFDPESPPDKCKFYVFVSQLYGHINMKRKEAYFLKLAANFITHINRPLCEVLLRRVASLYGIGALYGLNEPARIFWPSLQLSLAEELQAFAVDWQQYYNVMVIIRKSQLQIQSVQMFLNQYPQPRILQIFQTLNQDSLYSQGVVALSLPLLPKVSK